MNVNRITHSESETIEAGKNFSSILAAGDVVALYGDLGTGKTRFAKGISEGLGIDAHVSSPTFVVVNEYLNGKFPMYHFDFYRLKSLNELDEIGFEEYLFGKGICVIEWADLVEAKLPSARYNIHFSCGERDHERLIEIARV